MPMIRAMRLLNAVEAGTTTGAQLETLLTADPGRLAEFNVLLGMRGQTRRMAASSTAMAAVIASSTAMTAVAASSTAMAAVIASSTAMAAVIASSTAMTAVAASSTAMAAVAASSTAMTAVAASSTAMAAVAASKTALLACWNAETALTALRASTPALTALLASPFKSSVGGTNPSGLMTAMVAGKTILLQSRNAGGSDTNTLATKYQNGGAVANHVYTTTTSNSTQMVAFQDIKHTTYQNNYGWFGDAVKVD